VNRQVFVEFDHKFFFVLELLVFGDWRHNIEKKEKNSNFFLRRSSDGIKIYLTKWLWNRATWSANNFIKKLATSQLHIVTCCYVTNQLQTHLQNSTNNKYIFLLPKYELIWHIYLFFLFSVNKQFIVSSTTK
jgi:hypothetical protein